MISETSLEMRVGFVFTIVPFKSFLYYVRQGVTRKEKFKGIIVILIFSIIEKLVPIIFA